MTVTDIHAIPIATENPDGWTPVNLVDLPDKPPVRPTLGGTQLLYPGKRHVFSGPPESAKTLAAYAMLILCARTGGRGLLIDFEMGAYEARGRLRDLGATDQELARIGYLEPDTPATPQLIERLIAIRPDLVVIDAAAGAYDISGLDDNKRQDVERFSRLYVGLFWKAGIATVLVDHVTKNIEARGKFTIGSERKLGSSDVHLGFDTIQPISRGTAGRYKITTHKDRGGYLKRGHLADLHLTSDPDTHAIAWTFTAAGDDGTAEAGYFRPTHLMESVSRYLEPQPGPVTRNGVHDALKGKREYALKAVAALVTEGYVDERDGPNRSKLLASFRPYREEDDPAAGTEPGSRPELVMASSSGASMVPVDPDPEPVPSWFTRSGAYQDTPDLAYLDSISPDDEGDG